MHDQTKYDKPIKINNKQPNKSKENPRFQISLSYQNHKLKKNTKLKKSKA